MCIDFEVASAAAGCFLCRGGGGCRPPQKNGAFSSHFLSLYFKKCCDDAAYITCVLTQIIHLYQAFCLTKYVKWEDKNFKKEQVTAV